MKKFLVMLVFAVMTLYIPMTAFAATYTETVVTGLGSGYYMPWGTFSEGMCAISDGENYGYVNSDGKLVIGCNYSTSSFGRASSEFSEGVARTVINDKICFIDKTGKTVLATNYKYSVNEAKYFDAITTQLGCAAFHEGRACIVGDNGKWGFIDKNGNAITTFAFTRGARFENGKAEVHNVNGWNIIDLNGKQLLPKFYDSLEEQEDGSWYCYDLTVLPDVKVGTFSGTAHDTNSYDVYDANLNYVKNVEVNKKYETPPALDFSRIINKYGLDKNRYSYAYELGNGLLIAELKEYDADGNYKVLIDAATKKELAIPPFCIAEEFNDSGICVIGRNCTENNVNCIKIGAIDSKGNLLVPFNYLGSSWSKKFGGGSLLARRVSNGKLVVVKLTGTAYSAPSNPAQPSLTKIIAGSETISVTAYNIGGYNFYKIKDLQYVCANTNFAFSADWNEKTRSIELTAGVPEAGSTISTDELTTKNATPSSATIYKDGEKLNLTTYNIDGYTYFKLRNIGDLFGFEPVWNESDNSITLKAFEEE